MPRIELRDGQWAELRERISHAQDKEIIRTRLRGRTDETAKPDLVTATVRVFLRDWNVRDPDGRDIPVSDEDAVDRAPDDIVDMLMVRATELYTGATLTDPLTGEPLPNPTPRSSDASSSADG